LTHLHTILNCRKRHW